MPHIIEKLKKSMIIISFNFSICKLLFKQKMSKQTNYIWIAIGFFVVGCITTVCAGIAFWKSPSSHTCNDWETQLNYYKGYTCGYTKIDAAAASQCKTLCYCQSLFSEYDCLSRPPSGPSATLIGVGIFLAIVGILAIVVAIIITVLIIMKKY